MAHPWLAASLSPRRHDERGASLSAFVSVVVTALFLMGGLVVDGGAQSAATRQCYQVAGEAARAALDAASSARAGGRVPDSGAMLDAANSVLEASGVAGTASVSGHVVTVQTHREVSTTFLSLIRIDRLNARGEASARLHASS